MDQLASLKGFVAVAMHKGFAKAARDVGMATSSITRQVDSLEEHLGVQLLNRSTRQVTLTPAGDVYFEQAVRILDDLDEADRSVSEALGPPRGVLRVSAPLAFSRLHIAPCLAGFGRAAPDVTLDVVAADHVVNLVEERIDVAIRLGALETSSLIARKLAPHRRFVCASPDYLGEHGEPDHPEDLMKHQCLSFAFGDGHQEWLFERDGERLDVTPSGPIQANSSELLREAAIGGAGLIMMPSWLVGEDVRAGRLHRVLKEWVVGHTDMDASIHAVYLPNRRGSKKVRAFIEHLVGHFGTPPYWDTE